MLYELYFDSMLFNTTLYFCMAYHLFFFLVLKNLAQIKGCHFYEAGTFTVLFQKTIPGQEGSYHGFDVICLPSTPARGLFLGVVTSRSMPSSPVA